MQQVGNFVKGSLFAVLALAVIYSPFETEAETPEKVEIRQDVVTTAAILAPTAPVFESATVSATPTPEEKIAVTPTIAPDRTKVSTPSPKTIILAKNIVTSTPTVVSATPTSALQPVVAVSSNVPHDEHFTKYAAAFNVNRETLIRIARCESGFREGAVNGPYLGMFQYLDSTWQSTRNAMGENPDPSLRANAEEAIKTTAWKIAHGGVGAWPVCGR